MPTLEEFRRETEAKENKYWAKLRHQYIGMAMQGVMSNQKLQDDLFEAFKCDESMAVIIADFAISVADEIIAKLKGEK